jgi:hypothetical protein
MTSIATSHTPFLLDHLADDLLESFFDPAAEHSPPVLRAPHHVEGALEDDVAVRPQSDGHTGSIQHYVIYCPSGVDALTPTARACLMDHVRGWGGGVI